MYIVRLKIVRGSVSELLLRPLTMKRIFSIDSRVMSTFMLVLYTHTFTYTQPDGYSTFAMQHLLFSCGQVSGFCNEFCENVGHSQMTCRDAASACVRTVNSVSTFWVTLATSKGCLKVTVMGRVGLDLGF